MSSKRDSLLTKSQLVMLLMKLCDTPDKSFDVRSLSVSAVTCVLSQYNWAADQADMIVKCKGRCNIISILINI